MRKKRKRCAKCGEVKGVEEFSKNRNYKDGLWCYCKKCARKINKQWSSDNPEAKKAKDKRYCLKHKDKLSKKHKIYYQNNKEYIKQRVRNNYDPEKVKEYNLKNK